MEGEDPKSKMRIEVEKKGNEPAKMRKSQSVALLPVSDGTMSTRGGKVSITDKKRGLLKGQKSLADLQVLH